MAEQLSVLIIGAGTKGAFGPVSHAEAFQKAGFKIAGFVDSDITKACDAATLWGGEAFKSIDEAFDNIPAHKADVTVVAVPDDRHYEAIIQASMRACGLIFAEKPFTTSVWQAKEILENFGHFPFAVNYTRRFSLMFQEIAGLISDGELGKFLGGSGFYGNGLYHNGSHMIDMLRMLVGKVTVPGPGIKIADTKLDDPSVYGVIEVDGSPFYLGVIPRSKVNAFEAHLYFTQGMITVYDVGLQATYWQVTPRKDYPQDMVYRAYTDFRDIRKPMRAAVENIKNHLLHQAPLLSTGENAVEVLKICEAFAG